MTETAPEIVYTAAIVSAFVGANKLAAGDLPALIAAIHSALQGLGAPPAPPLAEPSAKPTPAQIRRSITPSHLISFEDGNPYKMMRRHLTARGLTPADYRVKWGLPDDYPVTAAAYSQSRSALAKAMGLGGSKRKAARPAPRAKTPTAKAQPKSA